MRISIAIFGCCLMAATSTFALAQAPEAKPAVGSKASPSAVYGKMLTGMEKEIVDAVEAMPEDKFNFAPTTGEFKGVRSFSGQAKHLTQANYYYYGGPKYDDAADKKLTDSLDKMTSKAEVVAALKTSFKTAHEFMDGITAENAFVVMEHGTRAGLAAGGLAHMMDHYGQMVVYLRMNGIIPPASRGN